MNVDFNWKGFAYWRKYWAGDKRYPAFGLLNFYHTRFCIGVWDGEESMDIIHFALLHVEVDSGCLSSFLMR